MKTWDIGPVQCNLSKAWAGHRTGDPDNLWFYGSAKMMPTFLDDRCECALQTTCEFHKELRNVPQ